MSVFRVMSILQAASGDPKDRFVNTMHFSNGDVGTDVHADVIARLEYSLDRFWTAFDPFIPTSLTREDYRIYNLTDTEPREVHYGTATAQPTGEDSPLPFEVSACLSVYADRNIRRRRGRVYIGPLTDLVAAVGEVNVDPQLSPAFRVIATDAAEDLQTDAENAGGGPGEPLSWGVYSPTDGLARRITNAWMDNAFDTIRSRGSASTQRTTVAFA